MNLIPKNWPTLLVAGVLTSIGTLIATLIFKKIGWI
jgi:hypothetical protein